MKVLILLLETYEGDEIVDVFDNEEAATTRRDERQEKLPSGSSLAYSISGPFRVKS